MRGYAVLIGDIIMVCFSSLLLDLSPHCHFPNLTFLSPPSFSCSELFTIIMNLFLPFKPFFSFSIIKVFLFSFWKLSALIFNTFFHKISYNLCMLRACSLLVTSRYSFHCIGLKIIAGRRKCMCKNGGVLHDG